MPKKNYSSKKTKYSDSESESEIEIPVVKKNKKFSKKVKYYESDSESSETEIENEEIQIKKRGKRKSIYKMINKTHINNIIFQDIDEKYSFGQYGDFDVIIDKSNGYINVTKMCKFSDNAKEFKAWLRNKSSVLLMDEISKSIGISRKNLTIIKSNGLNNTRGTYVHPILLTHIAQWFSIDFSVKIGLWIEKWKTYSKKNNAKYWESIKNIDFDFNNCKEKQLKLKLQKKLGRITEVPTPCGKIDLLTKNYIIEIKAYNCWKAALGQILAYSEKYPNKNKCVYLFDVPDDNDLTTIKNLFKKYDVELKIDF
ncbi:N-domain protein [Moumouvirus goulette]|uniref:N-domain protein n=1 Tax=Moumouvirus goulette TaxID=1247379 RepID=M1PCP6_9VIRU|nr:N-domain protein [Moumouvirus goulette]AGF85779.1 N-domain protein [Moumouvirus goulette]